MLKIAFALLSLSLAFSQAIFVTRVLALPNEPNAVQQRETRIRQALDARNFAAAMQELQSFRESNLKLFELNNYDYLLGRVAEKQNNFAIAIASFQVVVQRNSILRDYALWHLAQLARASGNLMLERIYLQQLAVLAPDSLLSEVIQTRLAGSFYESQDYDAVIQTVQNNKIQSPKLKTQNLKLQNQSPTIQNRQLLALLGNAYLRLGKKAEARNVFNDLIATVRNPTAPDDFALAATRGLDELDSLTAADFGRKAPPLPDFEHLRRAQIYQFNRDFAQAALHYQALVEQFPNNSSRPDAMFQLGRIASQEDRFDEAITQFERVQGEFPNHPAARDALGAEAAAYAKSGNVDEAISRYRAFIQKYVDSNANSALSPLENPERPFLNIIDALRDKGRDADALEWVRKTVERFKNQLPAAQALFSQARIHLAQGDWNTALKDLSELERAPDTGGARVPGGTDQTEIAFLKAFCLEKAQRYGEAISQYLSIPDGRGEYYGGRATERLRVLAESAESHDLIVARFDFLRATAQQALAAKDNERARQSAQSALRLTSDNDSRRELLELARRAYALLPAYKSAPPAPPLVFRARKLLEKPPSVVSSDLHQTLGNELLFLDLYDEAAPEFEAAAVASGSKSQVLNSNLESKNQSLKPQDSRAFTLAVFYQRADLANRAVKFAEPLWKSVPADYLLELAPRTSVELLYPAPYADFLRETTAPRDVDPRFMLSIMRQESRFRPDVKSNAAARGLMQFIPSTAAQIAAQLNQPAFANDDLYNPATAILFGAQYLSNIYRQFPGQPQAVAAAYNGGETNMLRWLVRSRSTDPDRYVAEIQFPQSKDYVYKVAANYRTYQMLYNKNLQFSIAPERNY